jgi:preprotein translocase subunit SecG
MYVVLVMVHLFIAVALVGVILLQSGKGADIGAAFGGGSSQTVFGGRGPTTFLHRLTTAIAVLFMATSLVLTVYGTRRGTSSVVTEEPVKEAPAQPGAPPVSTPPSREK